MLAVPKLQNASIHATAHNEGNILTLDLLQLSQHNKWILVYNSIVSG